MFKLKRNNTDTHAAPEIDDKTMLQLYAETSELVKVGGWQMDTVTGIINWTKTTRQIHEVDEDFTPELETAINFYKQGESRDRISLVVKNTIEHGEPFDEELQIITAKGNEKWVRAKGKSEFVKNKCIRIYGVFQDITEYKIKDIELNYSEKLLKQTIEYSPVGVARISPDGKILSLNKRICEIVGYNKDELMQISFHHLTYVEDMGIDAALMQQLIEGKINFYQVEKRYVTKSDNMVWVLLSVSLIRDKNGRPMHFVEHMIDITDHKKSLQTLRNERKLLETIIDNLPVNVYVKDIRSRKRLVNKMEVNFMGYTSKEAILGKTDYELFPQKFAEISIEEDQHVLTKGEPMLNKETYIQKHDGSEAWFLSSKIPLYNDVNEISGLLGISYDITDRKKYQELTAKQIY